MDLSPVTAELPATAMGSLAMRTSDVYYVIFPGEISRAERIALAARRLTLHEHGAGLASAYRSPRDGPFSPYQVIRVLAPNERLARERVLEALGREPEQLRVHTGLGDDDI